MTEVLLEIRGLCRDFPAGEGTIRVLDNVDLTIGAGEMVAIIGASGSGKSTLMNILGCLDRPTSGSYRVAGRDTQALDPDELAELRRDYFGFIFQRYHLLPTLSALGNVEIPAVYAGRPPAARRQRAEALLGRLGLGSRLQHRPAQLSGGQQQRVSVARALMNGGRVILADEPTGALDRESSGELMKLLEELRAEGHTIVLVTHDPSVARHARRIIEISDGRIVSDRRTDSAAAPAVAPDASPSPAASLHGHWQRYRESLRLALLALRSHKLRSFLTMLGIIIGIAAVVSVVALGRGSSERIQENISAIATNTIEIRPGQGFGDERSEKIQTLMPGDAEALAQQPFAAGVTPTVSTSASLRYGNVSVTGTINGVSASFPAVRGYELAQGIWFTERSVEQRSQEVVIDDNTRDKLFPNIDPLGEVIFLGKVPARVIGVTKHKTSPFGSSDALNVWLPYTTAMTRVIGQNYLQSITVRVSDQTDTGTAESRIVDLMLKRHGRQDFFVINTDTIRETIQQTNQTMTMLISLIAVISLIVGGIGVMNIMLVSVTERTREIGVCIAVGARRADILRQFLSEAVLVCLLGGTLGVGLSLAVGALLTRASTIPLSFSSTSILAAFGCSTLIGVVFGFLPARNAARLDPVVALARE